MWTFVWSNSKKLNVPQCSKVLVSRVYTQKIWLANQIASFEMSASLLYECYPMLHVGSAYWWRLWWERRAWGEGWGSRCAVGGHLKLDWGRLVWIDWGVGPGSIDSPKCFFAICFIDLFSHQFSLHGHGQPSLLQLTLQCHFIYFGTLLDEYHLNEQKTALLQKHSFVTRPSAI